LGVTARHGSQSGDQPGPPHASVLVMAIGSVSAVSLLACLKILPSTCLGCSGGSSPTARLLAVK
jgi:hypothetical protein